MNESCLANSLVQRQVGFAISTGTLAGEFPCSLLGVNLTYVLSTARNGLLFQLGDV